MNAERNRMKLTSRFAARSGAGAPGFLDVLTAAVLLAILLWVAWKQSPVYNRPAPPAAQGESATPAPDTGAH
jgi:hypothetical protein